MNIKTSPFSEVQVIRKKRTSLLFINKQYQNVSVKQVFVGFECYTSIQYFKLFFISYTDTKSTEAARCSPSFDYYLTSILVSKKTTM